MNREEYLKELDRYLKRLPKKDYESAMEHFEEYFEDAGAESEQSVIEELGTPREAASEVLENLLEENQKELAQEDGKKWFPKGKGIWISGLAILAAPIGVPLALTAIVMILTAGLIIMTMVLCVFVLSLASLFVGAKLLLRGIVAIPFSIPGALIVCGTGLAMIGCSILAAIAAIYLTKWLNAGVVRFSRRIIRKRRG